MSSTFEELLPLIRPFLADELIRELGPPIKSGKEGTVFGCVAHSRTGFDRLALKVYRPRGRRTFKNDAVYRDGRTLSRIGGGNTRIARAVRSGSRFGREVQGATWCDHEWEILCRLHDAGLPVPEPVHRTEHAILMELFTGPDGDPAAPLIEVALETQVARDLFDHLCHDIEDMLALQVVHGDLSPYNILWDGEAHRIIDLPQATDPRFNQEARRLLGRDLENVAGYCGRFCEVPDPEAIADELWHRFQFGELGAG